MALKVTLAWNGASTLIKSDGGWNNLQRGSWKKKPQVDLEAVTLQQLLIMQTKRA